MALSEVGAKCRLPVGQPVVGVQPKHLLAGKGGNWLPREVQRQWYMQECTASTAYRSALMLQVKAANSQHAKQ